MKIRIKRGVNFPAVLPADDVIETDDITAERLIRLEKAERIQPVIVETTAAAEQPETTEGMHARKGKKP